jgi:hypothetical protein
LKAIKRRKTVFAVLTGAGLVVSVLIFVCGVFVPEIQNRMLLTVSVLVSGGMAGLWAREHRKYETAQLIVENQILHIRPAVVSNETGDREGMEVAENIDVFVSYFGILMDSKIIKFNQDGISLKAVEIEPDFITFTYGREKWVQKTRLLRTGISREELQKIVERFRYETGITPVIID